MKICFVIQRYGLDVAGGAELHCRWLAERLGRVHNVEIMTTCARDYIRWENHYSAGKEVVNGIPVTRYKVKRSRSERRFSRISNLVFHEEHSLEEERKWVVENGPVSPALIKAIRRRQDVDLFIFYCYRYYQSFFGLPYVADRSILVPTAEDDPAINLPVFNSLFKAPRGILYLTPEERTLIQRRSGNHEIPSAVVGSGVIIPDRWESVDVKGHYSLPDRYLLYVGRIDRNKGVDRLLSYYCRSFSEMDHPLPLVLVGKPILKIPDHPGIRHLGFVPEEDKFGIIARCDLLLLPSRYESLSIIVLEAWAMGKPVLVNAECRVLEGQCVRSGGGLFYRGYSEFIRALELLISRPDYRSRMGAAGLSYVQHEYDWSVVEERTNNLIKTVLSKEGR